MKIQIPLAHTASIIAIALLTGCANTAENYNPIVDGPKDAQFQHDLEACKQLAEQREYINGDTKSEAILGAGIGALAGAIDGNSDDILGGVIVGGAVGAGEAAWSVRDERKKIVIQCMAGRGHKVVG